MCVYQKKKKRINFEREKISKYINKITQDTKIKIIASIAYKVLGLPKDRHEFRLSVNHPVPATVVLTVLVSVTMISVREQLF